MHELGSDSLSVFVASALLSDNSLVSQISSFSGYGEDSEASANGDAGGDGIADKGECSGKSGKVDNDCESDLDGWNDGAGG